MVLQWINGLATGTLFMPRRSDEDKRLLVDTMYSWYKQKFAGVKDLTPAQVMARPPTELLLVDCRQEPEQAISVLKGDVVLRRQVSDEELLQANKDLVFYCTIGYRSGIAAQKFAQQHPAASSRVYNLAGSCLGWAHAGGQFVKIDGETPVEQLHVVS